MEVLPLYPNCDSQVIDSSFESFRQMFEASKPNTTLTYFSSLRHWTSFNKLPHDLRSIFDSICRIQNNESATVIFHHFKQHLLTLLSPASVHITLSALSRCIRILHQIKSIPWLKFPDSVDVIPYRDTSGPPSSVVSDMIKFASARNDQIGIRDTAILHLLFCLALRRSEVSAINTVDYQPARRILFVTGKRRDSKQPFKISQLVADNLDSWIHVRPGGPGGACFTRLDPAIEYQRQPIRLSPAGIYNLVRKYSSQAKFPCSPHQLRHSAITSILNSTNGDLRLACQLSRHRSLATLQLYDDNRNGNASEAIQQLSVNLKGEHYGNQQFLFDY